MKRKRLISFFVIFILVVTVVVLNSTVFTVQSFNAVYKNEFDKQVDSPFNIDFSKIEEKYRGNNIFIVSENKIISDLNSIDCKIKVIGIERSFPSKVNVFYTQRIPVVVLPTNDGKLFAVDLDGVLIEEISDRGNLVTIQGLILPTASVGQALDLDSDWKMNLIFRSLSSIWCKVDDTSDISNYISVCGFDNEQLYFETLSGSKIKIENPTNKLETKILTALDVLNVTQRDSRALIKVYETNGNIETSVTYR